MRLCGPLWTDLCLCRMGEINPVQFFVYANLPLTPPFVDSLFFLQCMSMTLCQKVGGCCHLCGFASESCVTYHWSMCLSLSFCSYHSVYITVACGIAFRWGIVSPILFILCRWLWLSGPIFYDLTWIFLVLRNIVESFEGKLNWVYRLLW